jgi:hypothetical protein
MRVRKDAPFVLDFSNEPAVMFASPPKEHRVRRGEKLEVKAILVDPVLDVMIRHLDDLSQQRTEEHRTASGRTITSSRPVSLDPKVIVTRADGEKIAQGVMPFG